MRDNNQDHEYPVSWAAALAGVALFLICGLDLILGEIPHDWVIPSWLPGLGRALFLGSLVFPVIVLGIGVDPISGNGGDNLADHALTTAVPEAVHQHLGRLDSAHFWDVRLYAVVDWRWLR